MNNSLSIIIVSFNTKKILLNLLTDLKKTVYLARKKGYFIQIIVVDNNSADGTVLELKKKFKWVKTLVNSRNIGFSSACNKGILEAKGDIILFLNSDTKIMPETLIKCLNFITSRKNIDALTCRVELPNGKIDPACHRGFPTPWNSFCYFLGLEKLFPKSKLFSGYHQGWKDLTTTHEIDSCSGAFLMVKKLVIDKIGVLDSRYFMYGEDLDWCYRMKKAGFQLWYYPKTKIIHYKGTSGRKNPSNYEIKKQSKENFYETMKLFYEKHYKTKYPSFIYSLVVLGIWFMSKIRK